MVGGQGGPFPKAVTLKGVLGVVVLQSTLRLLQDVAR